MIIVFLIVQFIPLVLFPPESFSASSQEWWLPVLLAILALIATVNLIARRSAAVWPWYLIGFAQGLNIISRLMMLMPHATYNSNGAQLFNAPYVILSVISMAFSTFMLWYEELPEVRLGLVKQLE
jgi:hypothetical protein